MTQETQPVEKVVKAAKEESKKSPYVMKPKKAISAWIYFKNETVARLKAEEGLE